MNCPGNSGKLPGYLALKTPLTIAMMRKGYVKLFGSIGVIASIFLLEGNLSLKSQRQVFAPEPTGFAVGSKIADTLV
jgi:hypothetical protein